MKNKNYIWRKNSGIEVSLENMETSHLLNTVMYLTRRQKEYDETFAQSMVMGIDLPPLRVNGELTKTWIERMTKELARRQRKDVVKAQRILEVSKGSILETSKY